jgi:hypothetical protein
MVMTSKQSLFWILVTVALVVRLLVAILPGRQLEPPWSGGSDSQHYATLAENLLKGKGFTYAGHPTAFRPPVYPLFLALMMMLFGTYWALATRLLQFFISLFTALIVARTAWEIFGEKAFKPSFLFCLYCPTLVYAIGQIGTETLSQALIAAGFYSFVRILMATHNTEALQWASIAGCTVGVAALTRFSAPAVLLSGLYATFVRRHWGSAAVLVITFCLTLSPWLLRNRLTFGVWTYSTFSSFNLVKGILDPSGRSRGDREVKMALGWTHQEYEQNKHERPFPSELVMDAQCRQVYAQLVREYSWRLVPLHLAKLSWFWLSTDQLFDPGGRGLNGFIRRLMAVAWLLWLVMAGYGWLWLWHCHSKRQLAHLILWWVLAGTLAHLPFCMNSRLRSSIMDPIIAILSGIGWAVWSSRSVNDEP